MKKRPKLRLRTILFIVNLVVIIIPLGSIYFFRLYENELIRQTESELIVQGIFISAIYKDAVKNFLPENCQYGIEIAEKQIDTGDYYQQIPATLDLAKNEILAPRPDGMEINLKPDDIAVKAGEKINQVILDAGRNTLAGIKVLDSNGIVISGRKEMNLSFAHLEEIKLALSGKNTSILRRRVSDHSYPPLASISRGTGIRVFVAMPIILENKMIGVAYLSRSPRNILKSLYQEKDKVIVAGSVLLTAVLLLALLTSRTITKPVYQLIEQTKQIADGGKNKIGLINPVTKEIAMLSQSFTRMAETIAHRSEYIKNFAAYVSHEFKTPLTSIHGAIELLSDHIDSMPIEQRKKFLSNIVKDTNRLKKLVDRLLELAKADVLVPSEDVSDITKIVNQVAERYKDLGFTIVNNIESGVSAYISGDILETILTNILDNSCQHGADKVMISGEANERNVFLAIADNGSGISPGNAEKIFIPFFTTNREKGGTGLGLVIVRSLLEAYKGSISLKDSHTGAVFEIKLQKAENPAQ